MRTLLRRYTAVFISFLVFASVLVGFTQTNNVFAAPEFYGGEASCKKGDLQFQQISNFKTDPTTAPDGYSGLAFAALWSSSPAEYGRFIEGKQLAAYSSSYYLQGYCSGALSTGQFSNIGFILFPKISDVRVWEGFSATFTNGISTEIAAIRFTFTQDFSSYTVATLEESSTKLLSNGELPLNNLNSALDGWSYSTQSSLRPSNAPTNEITNQYVLDTIKAGIADNGGSPSIPPPVSDCTPLPLCRAEVSAVYEDAAHINISSIKFNDPVYEDIGANLLFFDNDLGNADTDGSDDLVYRLQNEVCSNGEYNRIDFDGSSTSLGAIGVNPRAVLRISFKTASGECTQQEASIAISNPVYALAEDGNPRSSVRASQIMYRLTSASVIRRVDAESDKEFTFELNTAFTIDGTAPELAYVRTDNIVARSGACSNFISRDSSNIKRITFVHDRGVGSCGVGTQTTGFLLVKADGSPVDPVLPATEEDQVAGDSEDTCDSGVGSFGWLVCPALEGIDSFINWAEDKIENQLTVDLGTKETRESLQDAWQIVARLASGVLVAIALVMVIATALGSDLVSPYALKKVLPRLVIGAIGIWLSWALVTTYIDIVNDVGRGIKALMLTPFVDAKEFGLSDVAAIAGAGGGGGGATGAIFVGLATYGVFSAGVFGLLSMGVTALFAFVVAIFVLALRQAVIVFLVIMAPLGFAMWILPNTQKTWKLWSGTLNKLLIMYPMIMGLLTAGKIFAWITAQSASNQAGLDKFLAFSIALIAFVAPYFFLPALFKAAGGVFSNLTGMVNDKGKGLYDKAKGGIEKRKTLSNRELAKKLKDQSRTAQRQRSYSNALTGTTAVGSYRRFKAGGIRPSGRRDVLATANAAARSTADKELESALSGDAGALKAVVSGDFKAYKRDEEASIATDAARAVTDPRYITAAQAAQKRIALGETVAKAQRLAGKHEGNRHSQAAALMQLANMGQAGEGEFKKVAAAFGSDHTAAATIIGAAKQASKSKGSLSAGAISYQDGKVGYINAAGVFVEAGTATAGAAKQDAVSQIIRGLSSDGYAQLGVDTSGGPGTAKFRDESVKAHFVALGRTEQLSLLNNPSIRIPPSAVEAMQNSLGTTYTFDPKTKVWR